MAKNTSGKWASVMNDQGEVTSYTRKEADDIQDVLVDERYASSGMVGAHIQAMIRKGLNGAELGGGIGKGIIRLSIYELRRAEDYLESYYELLTDEGGQ